MRAFRCTRRPSRSSWGCSTIGRGGCHPVLRSPPKAKPITTQNNQLRNYVQDSGVRPSLLWGVVVVGLVLKLSIAIMVLDYIGTRGVRGHYARDPGGSSSQSEC